MSNVQTVIDRANKDQQFRGRLKADPAAAFEEQGVEVPTGASIEVIDGSRGDVHLLLGARTNVPEVDRMMKRAENDAAFKELLLRDPRSAVEAHAGAKLPPECKVHVREADPNTIYLYLGDSRGADRELSEDELEGVSGGIAPILLGWLIGVGSTAGGFVATKLLTGPTGTLNSFNNPLD